MSEHLRDQHFLRLSRLIEGKTGIMLPASKRPMVEGRLRRRIREIGIGDLGAYGNYLFEQNKIEDELPFLVDIVTTNKTDFFREPDHFVFLRDQAVPALIRRADRNNNDLKIWSAAASMGAEAFTIAMVLATMQEAGTPIRFSILGTDISNEILEQARRAIYPGAMLDPVPVEMQRRYVMRAADPKRDEARIVPQLRRLVHFEQLNLMDDAYPFDRDVDVIFCRNVLIYFAREVQQGVLRRLSSHLRPGGYLILGHSESFALEDKAGMVQVSPTVFQRTDGTSFERAA